MLRRSLILLAVVAVLVLVIGGLGLAVGPQLGWATPFRLPATIHVDGRDYIQPGCHSVEPSELPLRRVGSVFGWFTGSKPIYVPHDEHTPKGQVPVVLFVRAGCVEVYGLSGGP